MQKQRRILAKCKERLFEKAQRGEALSATEQWIFDNANTMLRACAPIPSKYKPYLSEVSRLFPIEPLTEESLAEKLASSGISLTEDAVFMLPALLKAVCFQKLAALACCLEQATEEEVRSCVVGFLAANKLNMEHLHPLVSPVATQFLKDAVFSASSYETKLLYIDAVKKLSRESGLSEILVAKKVLSYPEPHIGILLCGKKRDEFRAFLGLKPEKRISPSLYIWMLLGTVYAASFLFYLLTDSVFFVMLARFLLIGFFSAVFSRLLLFKRPPRPLPRLALENGIPEEGKTVIVTPVFMGQSHDAAPLLEKLAKTACLCKDKNLIFALLVDFKESSDSQTGEDDLLLAALQAGIGRLKATYGNQFVCLVRHRIRDTDGIFRPKERKRGALCALGKLLTKDDDSTFRYISDRSLLRDIRFVITLDSDTVLPGDAAKKLIATMLHPLNRPEVKNGIVTQGYGVIQPRIAVDFLSGHQTLFSSVYSGGGGLDPYSAAASDFYQEIFEEGIYTGKGIYDPRIFDEVLSGAIPENRVLSHDLLEGAYTRCGLCSDITFIDGYPSSYLSFATRAHRWIRGDWQLLPWLWHRVRTLSGKGHNPLQLLSKWKIFDNLRRSVFEPVVLLLLLGSFYAKDSWLWLCTGLLAVFIPVLLRLYALLLSLRQIKYRYMRFYPGGTGGAFLHSLFSLAFLPHTAWQALDAVTRTLYRLLISKKNLLQWVTAADADKNKHTRGGVYKAMWMCPVLGIILPFAAQKLFPAALALGFLWLIAPLLAYQSAQPPKGTPPPTQEEENALLLYAGTTWRYFDTHVTEKTHDLPPDNFQESPPVGIAYRTSPTNIGLYLLSLLFAARISLISEQDFRERLDRALTSLFAMERKHGHFYNWYDLKDLSPLSPHFISTVDSGNLLACLLTVREGLKEDFSPRLCGLRAILAASKESYVVDEHKSFSENLFAAEATPLCAETRAALQSFRKTTSVSKETLLEKLSLLIAPMDFTPLYDARTHLFAIGMDGDSGARTNSCYDLLASEARLGTYIAIATGQVPSKAWLSVARPLCHDGGRLGLASWSGTAFEYLMPRLFLPEPDGSMLGNAAAFCTYANARFCRAHRLPFWGVSESAFFAFDRGMNYRYRALGVPALSLSRTKPEALCVAPYAAGLALSVNPRKAYRNLQRAHAAGMLGKYGFYEAFDKHGGMVRSYMAHHQGMLFLALCNRLTETTSAKLFSRIPQINAYLYLLGETLPQRPNPIQKEPMLPLPTPAPMQEIAPYHLLSDTVPEDCVILSNGTFSTLLTASLSGYSKTDSVYLTRFRRQPIVQGLSLFLAEEDAAFRLGDAGMCRVMHGTVQWTLSKQDLVVSQTVVIPSDKTEEYRRVCISNASDKPRTLRLSVYLEPTLLAESTDLAHPAFCDLFLSIQKRHGALYAVRRPLSASEPPHTCRLFLSGSPTYYTDRLAFGTPREGSIPIGAVQDVASEENPAEPCMAGAVCLTIPPKQTACVYLSFGLTQGFLPPKLTAEHFDTACADARRREVLFHRLLGISAEGHMLLREALPFLVFPGHGNADLKTSGGMDGLYRFGISGDNPYLLFIFKDEAQLSLLRAALCAYRLWQSQNFAAELVVLCDDAAGYTSPLYEAAASALSAVVPEAPKNSPLGVYLLPGAEISLAARNSLRLCAAYIIDDTPPVRRKKEAPMPSVALTADKPKPQALHLDNGYGGFSGHEYIIYQKPPVPWSHPLANETFGTWESTDGTVFSWHHNSRLCQITPWRNMRGIKTPPEYFTLNGKRFSDGLFRFGLGYCVQEGYCEGIYVEKTVFVPPSTSGKFVLLRLKNTTDTPQTIATVWHLTITLDESESKAYGKIRYAHGEYIHTLHNKTVHVPRREAMVHLPPHAEETLVFYMGADTMPKENPLKLLADTKAYFEALCSPLRIQTPDAALDTFFNERLAYQTIVCRLWARSSPYQCGGAFGYRDQLQDILSLLYTHADMAKSHILKCAALVYEEGDVPHWWHELPNEAAKGIRTHCSDDGLWLIYAISRYIDITEDYTILSEEVGYLKSLPLAPNEKERYETLEKSTKKDSVYHHLLTMADGYITHGKHSLPLMRGGDWNDGFGAMGEKHKGESVWLCFFLADVLKKLASLCFFMQDTRHGNTYKDMAAAYLAHADAFAWDGAWYLRAFHDDGNKIGSAQSAECQIDGLVQAWAALVHPTDKARLAMESAWQYLWDERHNTYALFTPAFTKRKPNPGYVAAYHPGVRENGGQYTHAAIWTVCAHAALGNTEKAAKLLCAINPLSHTKTPAQVEHYKAEPYAVCADVYSTGRGGWSWYTGSAGWYREAVISSLFGFRKKGATVTFSPCLPQSWDHCLLEYRYYDTLYRFHMKKDGPRPVIELKNTGGIVEIEV